jgi:hypothetical protein
MLRGKRRGSPGAASVSRHAGRAGTGDRDFHAAGKRRGTPLLGSRAFSPLPCKADAWAEPKVPGYGFSPTERRMQADTRLVPVKPGGGGPGLPLRHFGQRRRRRYGLWLWLRFRRRKRPSAAGSWRGCRRLRVWSGRWPRRRCRMRRPRSAPRLRVRDRRLRWLGPRRLGLEMLLHRLEPAHLVEVDVRAGHDRTPCSRANR